VKYLRRLIWYLASRLLVMCCVLGLMTIAFYYSMNFANVYIVLKDGMSERAKVIMMDTDRAPLFKYFSNSCIERDTSLAEAASNTSPYKIYSITGFDHRLAMEWMWCWPWENTATAVISESIPAIDGKIKTEARAAINEGQNSIPHWPTTRYSVVLSRESGQWRVKNINVIRQ
jgi:hypothetical protein